MSKDNSQHTIRNLIELVSLLIMTGVAVKKLLEWMHEWEGGSKEQGLVTEVMKLVQPQAAPAKSKSLAPRVVAKPQPKLPALNLNRRQEQIYNLLRAQGEVKMSALSAKFSEVSSRTLRRDLTQLETLGLISQSGKTKNSIYKLL